MWHKNLGHEEEEISEYTHSLPDDQDVLNFARDLDMFKRLKTLSFQQVAIAEKCTMALAKALESNKTVTDLSLGIRTKQQGFAALGKMLIENTTLKVLSVNVPKPHYVVGDFFKCLALNKTLEWLHLCAWKLFLPSWRDLCKCGNLRRLDIFCEVISLENEEEVVLLVSDLIAQSSRLENLRIHPKLFRTEYARGLLLRRGFEQNFTILSTDFEPAKPITVRNAEIQKLIKKSVYAFLAVRRFRRSALSVIPYDVIKIIARMLWSTRGNGEVWSGLLHY